MATGFTALQGLKECPVCWEELTDPRALPCDHLLCQDCVDHIKKGIQIKCPVCNTTHDVRKVRRDFRLMQFLDALKEENTLKHNQQTDKEPYCQVCSHEGANYWCKECQQWMCNGCDRLHNNIATCRNHITEPLSTKIREIKSQYENDASTIQDKIHHHTHAANVIEDKISELEMTQMETLEVSSGLRKKCHEDIDQVFDSIDAEIVAFIGDQTAELDGFRNGLVSQLNGLETKSNRLKHMIKDDSRELIVDGRAILADIKQINDLYSDFEVKCDNISIKVVQDSNWNPSNAALLQKSGIAQITSRPRKRAIKMKCSMSSDALPNVQSKPNLSTIANKHYKRRQDVALKHHAECVRFIDNKLWVGTYHRISIYKLNLKRITKWKNAAWGFVNDVADVRDKTVVIVSSNGLFHVDSKGRQISEIDTGEYSSGMHHNGTLYVYEINSHTIRTYAYNSSWNTKTTMPSPVEIGNNTLSISDTTITICSHIEHKLYIMNHSGHVIHTIDTRVSGAARKLVEEPYLCQEDDAGVVLVADDANNRLQIFDAEHKWSIVKMDPEVSAPVSAVYVNGVVYVVSIDNKKLYSYKAK